MTIVTRDYYVSRIGPFRPTADPRISAAIRAFPSSSIRRKHPEAQFGRGSWGLVLAQFPFGASDEPSPILSARVGGGRVRALEGDISGAGE